MGHIIYPKSWEQLILAPVARAELISYVRSVSKWNWRGSYIKKHGADDLIGFFYDVYNADQGAHFLIGQILFADEAECFDDFFQEFDRFITERQKSHGLNRLHEATIPLGIEERAGLLLRMLEDRGVPEWRD